MLDVLAVTVALVLAEPPAPPPVAPPAPAADKHALWWKEFAARLDAVQTRPLVVQDWDPKHYLPIPTPTAVARVRFVDPELTVELQLGRAVRRYRITLLPDWRGPDDDNLVFYRVVGPDGKERVCASGRSEPWPGSQPEQVREYGTVGRCFIGLTKDAACGLHRDPVGNFSGFGKAKEHGFADLDANGGELDIRLMPGPPETGRRVIRMTSKPD